MKQFNSYIAKYTKLTDGYMGQLMEWPEVVTEGSTLEECRAMLRDALYEMILAYNELGKEIPVNNALIELLPVEILSFPRSSVGMQPGTLQRPETGDDFLV